MSESPPSDYDGYSLDQVACVRCPDCERRSPDTDELDKLLAWIDEHNPACTGEFDQSGREEAYGA